MSGLGLDFKAIAGSENKLWFHEFRVKGFRIWKSPMVCPWDQRPQKGLFSTSKQNALPKDLQSQLLKVGLQRGLYRRVL